MKHQFSGNFLSYSRRQTSQYLLAGTWNVRDIDIVQIIQLRRLTYFGQVVRMDNVHLPRIGRTGGHTHRRPGRPLAKEVDWQYCGRLSANGHICTWSWDTGLGYDRHKWWFMVHNLGCVRRLGRRRQDVKVEGATEEIMGRRRRE